MTKPRQKNLLIYTNIFLFSVIAAYLSKIFYDYAYKLIIFGKRLSPYENPFSVKEAYFFGQVWMKEWIIDFSVCALIIALCIWGLAIAGKKKNQTKISIIGIVVLSALGLFRAIFHLIQASIKGAGMGISAKSLLPPGYFISFLREDYLLISVLIVGIVLIIAWFKKDREKMPAIKNEKSGLGGFFIIPLIRNIAMPLNYLVIIFQVILLIFGARGLIGFKNYSNTYAISLIFVIVLLAVLSVIAVIQMFQKKRTFVPLIISVEIIAIIQYMQKIIFDIFANKPGDPAFAGSIPFIVASILFCIYYSKSSRVKNTFIK